MKLPFETRQADYPVHATHATRAVLPGFPAMLSAFSLAVADLRLPAMRGAALKSLALSLLLFVALLAAMAWLLSGLSLVGIGWLDTVIDVLGGAALLVISVLLFPSVTAAILPLFLDRVAAAVEARHYPDLPPPRPASAAAQAWAGLRLAAIGITLNLLALPVVLLVPVVGIVVFVLLNGWLMGREYFELVALRRMGPAEARAARAPVRWKARAGGAVLAALGLVPFGNLLVPLLGAAAFVHVFHRSGGLARRHMRV
jgi:CysZ protein